jgi:uncharacterized membrane protein YidH (DUF202 family)
MEPIAAGDRPRKAAETQTLGVGPLAWIGGALATVAAGVAAAVLAVFFAATVVVVGVLGLALLGLGGFAYRARKGLRRPEPGVIEARHVGGHSWVAYGWDQHR